MAKGYEFIIIGGGAAGSALAGRLSEDPAAEVLLLKAGGSDRHPVIYHPPARFAKMTKEIGRLGWDTTPQKHMQNKVFCYTKARVIGHGSAINSQIYTRGNAQDCDDGRQMGGTGWGNDDLLPYFRKAKRQRDP